MFVNALNQHTRNSSLRLNLPNPRTPANSCELLGLRFCLTRLTNPYELVHEPMHDLWHDLLHELLHELLYTRQRQNPATVFNHHLPTLPTRQLRGFHDALQLGPHRTVPSSGITPRIDTAGLKLACEGCLAVRPAPDSIVVWVLPLRSTQPD